MGFSSIVAEGIMLVAVVIASAVFASAIVDRMNQVNEAIKMSMKQQAETIMTKIAIAYATYDDSIGLFIIYVKNIGKYPITAINKLNVYFGEYGKAQLYTYDYDGSLAPGEWSYVEIDGKKTGVWEPGETLEILIYNTTAINDPCYIKIVTPSGVYAEDEFMTKLR